MKPDKCWAPNGICNVGGNLCSTLSSTCQRRPTPCPEYEEAGNSPAAGMVAESIGAWPCRYCGEAREKHPPVTEACGDPACPSCSPDRAWTGHLYKCHAEPSVTVQLTLKPVLTDLRVGGSANLLAPWTRGACSECGDDILLTRGEARPEKDIVGICDVCHGHKVAEKAMDAVVADLQRARVDLQEVLYYARDKHGDDPEAYAHLERLLALTKPE